MKDLVIIGHGKSFKGYDCGACGCGQEEHKTAEGLGKKMQEYSTNIDYVFNHNHFVYKDIGKYKNKYKTITEIHLNASNGQGHGTEVLIKKGLKGDKLDKRLNNALAKFFRNRGIKGANLTNANICYNKKINYRLIEICFIDNYSDMKILNNHFDDIAKELVKAIENKEIKKEDKRQKCVMYYRDGNELTAKFIAQQLKIPVFKDNGRDLPNKEHKNWNILYIGDLGENRQDTASVALEKFLGLKK